MNEKLRIGCIGAGSSGVGQIVLLERYHLGCVVAFCDLDRRLFDIIIEGYLSGQAAKEAGDFETDATGLRPSIRDITFYTDPEEMFDKEDLDAVIIATYCNTHCEMVERAAKRGLHILLEKPIGISEEEVEKVWRLLKDYPRVAAVNFTMRGAPVSVAAREHVRRGSIGKIVSVQYVNNVHYGDNYFRGWMRTRDKIGSMLLQKAVHDFDIINNITDLTPARVAAFGSRLVYGGDMPNDLTCDVCERKWTCPMSVHRLKRDAGKPMPPKRHRKCVYAAEVDIKDNHTVIIEYEGGTMASYSQTLNAPLEGGRRGGAFIGTGGIMNLEYYDKMKNSPSGEMIVGQSRIDIIRYHQKPSSRIHEVYDWHGNNHFDGTEYGIVGELGLLRGGPSEAMGTIKEGYISAKMCLAAQESMETGRVVDLKLSL